MFKINHKKILINYLLIIILLVISLSPVGVRSARAQFEDLGSLFDATDVGGATSMPSAIPGIPEGFGTSIAMPYGGQVMWMLPCTCSVGMLYIFHDFRSNLWLPLILDLTSVSGLSDSGTESALKSMDPTKISLDGTGVEYYTPQNFYALPFPGHYQLGWLGAQSVCSTGVPPFCTNIQGIKIKKFGNGGVPADVVSGGATVAISALSLAALGPSLAESGSQLTYLNGPLDTSSESCGATMTNVEFSGNGETSAWLYIDTTGRDSWPVEVEGGGFGYEYVWEGAVTGEGDVKFKPFFTDGVKEAKVTVTSGENSMTATCPAVMVADQGPNDSVYAQNIVVSCGVDKNTVTLNQPVLFSATVFGATSDFTYNWSGDVVWTGNSTTTSFNTPGVKVAKVTVTDSESDAVVTKYCPPVTVTVPAPTHPNLTAGTLSLTCTVNPSSVTTGQVVTYTATARGGTYDTPDYINAELLLNGHRVDWMRVGQDSKDLVNMFNGYYAGDIPESGEMVEVKLVSMDGQCVLVGEAAWP